MLNCCHQQMAIIYEMAVGLKKGRKLTPNVKRVRPSRRKGVNNVCSSLAVWLHELVYLSACPSASPSVCLDVSVCFPHNLSDSTFLPTCHHKSVCLYVSVCLHISVCLSLHVCLSAQALTKHAKFVRDLVREVSGFAPYEKRTMELLKISKDKRALKFCKKRVSKTTSFAIWLI